MTTTTRNSHDYDHWIGDDGRLYLTVIPEVWETMTQEAWLRAARRKTAILLREAGLTVERAPIEEVDRDEDYATDLPLTITYRTVESYNLAPQQAA